MIEEFWARFVAATGIDGPYQAWPFGGAEMPELADELAALVIDGPKRATASLVSDFGAETESGPMPMAGDLSVILSGAGSPICVIRTTQVEVKPFGEVDEQFAWDEGEGDRSLKWWREAHQWYFSEVGTPIDDDTPVVLERFELLWSPTDG